MLCYTKYISIHIYLYIYTYIFSVSTEKEKSPNETVGGAQLYFKIKSQTLQRGYKETLVHIRGKERSPAPPSSQQETEPDITLNSVSCGVPGQQWPATGTRYLVAADLEDMDVAKVLLEEVAISSNVELPSK